MSNDPSFTDEDEWISKSEIKREADKLKKLGVELVGLTNPQIESISMSATLREAIALAKRLKDKREAARRHMNYIGKVLRTEDIESINAGLDKIRNKHIYQAQAQLALEKRREQLIEEGDPAINALVEKNPALERQKLRQLVRQAKKELEQQKPAKAHQDLLKYLKLHS
ncbi:MULTISPECIES: ribosome biogenesis factor YjgA [unclassified Agarivorans]|uniref:ribosome biogenesis factor YjgA n=1 Tax=unclassified Agarivorans TaxID=2636026 RepID=UPI003D7CD394